MNKKEQETREKFDVLNRLLDDEYVIIHVDTSVEGLILPEYLLKETSVTLKLSRYFKGGIEVGPEIIQTNLSFNKEYFPCTIPLKAIWGASSQKNENIIWPDSTPLDYLKSILERQIAEPQKKSPPKTGNLRRVK